MLDAAFTHDVTGDTGLVADDRARSNLKRDNLTFSKF